MKKIISILLVLSLLALTACGDNNTGATVETRETITTPVVNACHSDEYTKSFYDYDEYLAYFTENTPENFVFYEQIAHMGEFQRFLSLHITQEEYFYYLKDENGVEFTIKIRQPNNLISNEYKVISMPTEQINKKSMYYPDEEYKNSCIEINGIIYIYVAGSILCMEWATEEHTFCISNFGDSVYEYGRENDYETLASANIKDTFISRLLSPETAGEAIEQFEASLKAATK